MFLQILYTTTAIYLVLFSFMAKTQNFTSLVVFRAFPMIVGFVFAVLSMKEFGLI